MGVTGMDSVRVYPGMVAGRWTWLSLEGRLFCIIRVSLPILSRPVLLQTGIVKTTLVQTTAVQTVVTQTNAEGTDGPVVRYMSAAARLESVCKTTSVRQFEFLEGVREFSGWLSGVKEFKIIQSSSQI